MKLLLLRLDVRVPRVQHLDHDGRGPHVGEGVGREEGDLGHHGCSSSSTAKAPQQSVLATTAAPADGTREVAKGVGDERRLRDEEDDPETDDGPRAVSFLRDSVSCPRGRVLCQSMDYKG